MLLKRPGEIPLEGGIGSLGGGCDDSESWSWGACARLVVCTLVRQVVSACEWGGMLAGTLVYQPGSQWDQQTHGSRTGGST